MPVSESHFLLSTLSARTVLEAAAMLLVFVGFLFLGSKLLPGHRVTGPEIEGQSRTYKLNGLALFLITAIGGCLAHVSGLFSLSQCYIPILPRCSWRPTHSHLLLPAGCTSDEHGLSIHPREIGKVS